MKRFIAILLLLASSAQAASVPPASTEAGMAPENANPSVVGWGNLLVPGLGATLLDKPGQGLFEATTEIGTFYGGTLLAPEKRFRIDGTIDLPYGGNINNAAIAQTLQQFGLKYHFYNTFIHYREAAIAEADSEREKSNKQPLYMGTTWNMFTSPFRLDTLSSPWVWPVILGGAGILTYLYKTTAVTLQPYQLTPAGEALYGTDIVGANPVGSYMGEDPLFRGFMQREIIGETGSVPLAIISQAAVFSLLHDNRPFAAAAGLYLGLSTYENHGNFEKAMAVHFWLDMLDGLFTYLDTRRAAGENVPLMPPIGSWFKFEF